MAMLKRRLVRPVVCLLLVLYPALSWAEVLKVVALNVWSGLDYKGNFVIGEYEPKARRELRYRLLVQDLQALGPDVIGLNEANFLPDYATRIAGDLGYAVYDHVGVGGVRLGRIGFPVNMREGDVLLGRPGLNFTPQGRRQLSGGYVGSFATFHFSDATQVIAARIEVAGRMVFVFNTHWHSSAFADRDNLMRLVDEFAGGQISQEVFVAAVADAVEGRAWRLSEAQQTLEFVREIAGEHPAILLGDFNALPTSEEIALLLNAGFVDAYAQVNTDPGYTWDEVKNANIAHYYFGEQDSLKMRRRDRIDYIFVRGDALQVLNARVVFDVAHDGVHISDHFGVYAEIEVLPAGDPKKGEAENP